MRSTRSLTSRSLSSSSSHQMTACRPDFRFGLCEIGAFSLLLCRFCGLGCGEAAARKRLRLRPRRWGLKKPGRFWGAPRPPNEKPGAVSRPGLDTLLKDIFLYTSPVSTSRSHKLHRSVTSCTTHRLYSASQEVFVGHPIVGVRPMKNPARYRRKECGQS